MKRLLVAALAAVGFVLSGTAHAEPVVLDFDGEFLFFGEDTPVVYTEDGFDVDATGTSRAIIDMGFLREGLFEAGEVIVITRSDGGLFSFEGLQFGAFAPDSETYPFNIFGFLAGMEQFMRGPFTTDSSSRTSVPGVMALIDTLVIAATGGEGKITPYWDNIILHPKEGPGPEPDPIPLPAAFPLFLAGIGGLGFARRMRRKESV